MYEYTVYILHCADDSFYSGVTNDLERRMREHADGIHPESYTYSRRPVTLVYSAAFNDVHDAIAWEKKIKRWSRKKKQALIEGNQEMLEHYSKRRGGKPKSK